MILFEIPYSLYLPHMAQKSQTSVTYEIHVHKRTQPSGILLFYTRFIKWMCC